MPTTSPIHLEYFLGGLGTLCGAIASVDAITLLPEKVTCPKCLTLMRRTRALGGDEPDA